MAGRRSHPRFAVATPWDGSMRVLKDVVLHKTDSDELLAVSRAPGIVGEEMTLDVMGAGASIGLRVRVIDSRPVIVDGTVCHRLRLFLLCQVNNEETEIAPDIAAESEAASEATAAPLIISGPLAEAI
jgi:hypothetical protein